MLLSPEIVRGNTDPSEESELEWEIFCRVAPCATLEISGSWLRPSQPGEYTVAPSRPAKSSLWTGISARTFSHTIRGGRRSLGVARASGYPETDTLGVDRTI